MVRKTNDTKAVEKIVGDLVPEAKKKKEATKAIVKSLKIDNKKKIEKKEKNIEVKCKNDIIIPYLTPAIEYKDVDIINVKHKINWVGIIRSLNAVNKNLQLKPIIISIWEEYCKWWNESFNKIELMKVVPVTEDMFEDMKTIPKSKKQYEDYYEIKIEEIYTESGKKIICRKRGE